MRDFLTDLVRRTLAPDATVQPRIPSRFELAADPELPLALEDEALPQLEPRQHRELTPRAQAPARPRAEAERASIDAARRSEARATAPSDQEGELATVRTVIVERAVAEAPSEAGRAVREEPARTREREKRDDPPPRLRPMTVGVVRPASPDTSGETRPARAGSQAVDGQMKPPAPALAESTEQAPLPPDIRISIGRIEVRATVGRPARADRQADRTPQRQSLNEYLDERARGGRR